MCEFVPLCCGLGSMGVMLHELFFFKPDAVLRTSGLRFLPAMNPRMFVISYKPSAEDPEVLALGVFNGPEHPFVLGASIFQLPLSFGLNSEERIEMPCKLRDAVIAELLSYGGHTVEYSSSTFTIPNLSGFCGINIIFVESTCNRQFCVKIMGCLDPTNTTMWVVEYVFQTSKAIRCDKRLKSSDLIASFAIPVGVRESLRD